MCPTTFREHDCLDRTLGNHNSYWLTSIPVKAPAALEVNEKDSSLTFRIPSCCFADSWVVSAIFRRNRREIANLGLHLVRIPV